MKHIVLGSLSFIYKLRDILLLYNKFSCRLSKQISLLSPAALDHSFSFKNRKLLRVCNACCFCVFIYIHDPNGGRNNYVT